MENNDLIAEMSQATEKKPEVEVIEAVVLDDNAGSNSNNGTNEPEPEKKEFKNPPKYQARMIIMFIDNLGKMILPDLYRRKMFTAKDEETLKNTSDENLRNNNLTPEEQTVFKKYEKYREHVKGIPLTETEIECLEEPMSQVIEKYGLDMGPEFMLGMCIIGVFGSRVRHAV